MGGSCTPLVMEISGVQIAGLASCSWFKHGKLETRLRGYPTIRKYRGMLIPFRLGRNSGLMRVRGMDETAVQIRPQTYGGSFKEPPAPTPTGDGIHV